MRGVTRWRDRLAHALPKPLFQHVILRGALVTRGMTLGVRTLVTDEDGRVLLVRHSYIRGWYFPGGAVDVGEAAPIAAVRELREEAGIRAIGAPALLGLYLHRAGPGRDHVALYHIERYAMGADQPLSDEIAEAGWFGRDELPAETSTSTRARLAEVFDGAPVSPFW